MIGFFKDVLRGFVIGVANVIPGVSGGTMALVMGIYERFIGAIHNLSAHSVLALVDLVKPGVPERFTKFKREFENLDAWFLIKIGIGAAIAILSLAGLMSFLLTEFHDPTYGFFWGLVLVSVLAPYQLIKKKSPILVVACVLGASTVIGLTGTVSDETLIQRAENKYEIEMKKRKSAGALIPASGPDPDPGVQPGAGGLTLSFGQLLAYTFMGAAAISAMILPGISGSLLLLIMGGYFEVLGAIDEVRGLIPLLISQGPLPVTFVDSLALLVFFAGGCGLGLLFFSRLLDYLLRRFHDFTMSFLVGLVLGSLWSIWPFKNTAEVGGAVVYLGNTLPSSFGLNEIATAVACIAGALLVGGMIWMERRFATDSTV